MGKATAPSKTRRKRATAEQRAKGNVEHRNGQDVNHGNSLVSIWQQKNMLTESQEAAIAYCNRIWELIGQQARVTANYGEQVAASTGDGEGGGLILRRMQASDDLNRIRSYIPTKYWQVFENCIRFDEPTGQLGSRLHGGTKTGRARAHAVSCFVADIICMKERLS